MSGSRLHQAFQNESWHEIRVDIDPRVEPDLVGSITNLSGLIAERQVDAVWCSHSLEHLYAHELVPALDQCRRVLKQDGFALITSPDLVAVMDYALREGLDAAAYTSPAGPITPLDMLFGHGRSIARGNGFMAHKTGLSVDRLGRLAIEAGFTEARISKGLSFDLWAILTMPDTRIDEVFTTLAGTNIEALFQ